MARPKRYTPEQITRILKQQEVGICEQTFYCWKSKYGGLGVSEVHRLKAMVTWLKN